MPMEILERIGAVTHLQPRPGMRVVVAVVVVVVAAAAAVKVLHYESFNNILCRFLSGEIN